MGSRRSRRSNSSTSRRRGCRTTWKSRVNRGVLAYNSNYSGPRSSIPSKMGEEFSKGYSRYVKQQKDRCNRGKSYDSKVVRMKRR